MIEPVVEKRDLHAPNDDLAYWLSRPIEERISAVEILRRQHIGPPIGTGSRLERVCSVIRLERGSTTTGAGGISPTTADSVEVDGLKIPSGD